MCPRGRLLEAGAEATIACDELRCWTGQSIIWRTLANSSAVSTPLLRCPWANGSPLYAAYHDLEWGQPVHDDRVFFEFLILEGAQAGLSWSTILNKRDGYRAAFSGFDPALVARFNAKTVARLMTNPAIVRNRLKIQSAVNNARAY